MHTARQAPASTAARQRRVTQNSAHQQATHATSYIARMTQPRCFAFRRPNARLTHMLTSTALPATITPQTHARADTRDVTSHTQHNGTVASWRVSPKTAHTCKPRTPHRTLARSIQTHKPRTLARHPAQHQPLHSAQTSLHAYRRAHVTHSTTHSSDHPTHHTQKITPSLKRGLRATLTAELSGCPASTGCCRRVGCCSSTGTCRTNDQPSRHIMAHDAAADPSQPPATQRSA
jgi:hypothetical protein